MRETEAGEVWSWAVAFVQIVVHLEAFVPASGGQAV